MADDEFPWDQWLYAARSTAVSQSLPDLYATLDAQIAERNPKCVASGRCCRFDSYQHRLYVTGLELAWVVVNAPNEPIIQVEDHVTVDGCPYQSNGLCAIREWRPMGCRIFFCDPDAQAWENEVYEAFLTQLRSMHDSHNVPYRYVEWRYGLTQARYRLISER